MTPDYYEPPGWLRAAGIIAILLSNLIGVLTR